MNYIECTNPRLPSLFQSCTIMALEKNVQNHGFLLILFYMVPTIKLYKRMQNLLYKRKR